MGDKRITKSKRQKRVIRGLDNTVVLDQLLELAHQLEVTVRQEKGDFQGGSCRIDEDKFIFLKKTAPDVEKIGVLLHELIKFDLGDIEIDSTLRDYMDQLRQEIDDDVAV